MLNLHSQCRESRETLPDAELSAPAAVVYNEVTAYSRLARIYGRQVRRGKCSRYLALPRIGSHQQRHSCRKNEVLFAFAKQQALIIKSAGTGWA